MSNISAFSIITLRKQLLLSFQLSVVKCNYAKKETGVSTVPKKKKLGKIGPMMEKKVMPVETDTNKLVNFCCGSNINVIGQDVALKADSEYPDWLWGLRTGPAPTLEELDPESWEYWRKIRGMGMKRNNTLSKLKKF